MKHYELVVAGGGPVVNGAVLAAVDLLKEREAVHAMDR